MISSSSDIVLPVEYYAKYTPRKERNAPGKKMAATETRRRDVVSKSPSTRVSATKRRRINDSIEVG